MAAHRHWRVFILSNNGNSFTGVTELEFRDTPGGADLTGSGTASAAATIQAGSAAEVFDGSLSTFIQWSGDGNGKWIAYDFGVGVEHDIVEVVMYTNKDVAARGPKDWTLQYSDDGSTWFESGLVCYYTAWVIGTPVTFTMPVGTLQEYARVRWGTSETGLAGSCAELEFRATVGGADQSTGGTFTASTTFSGTFSADKAFDDNTATFWAAADADRPLKQWLSCQFTAPVDVHEVLFTARNDGNANQSPLTGWIEVSGDGRAWLSAHEFSVGTWSAGETQTLLSIAEPPAVAPTRRAVWLYY